jgi:cell division protein FtsB
LLREENSKLKEEVKSLKEEIKQLDEELAHQKIGSYFVEGDVGKHE